MSEAVHRIPQYKIKITEKSLVARNVFFANKKEILVLKKRESR